MRNLLLLSVLWGFSISLAQAGTGPYNLELGRYHALIISNQEYKQLAPLKTPHTDADALAAVLRQDYGFRVTSLRDNNRATTLDALDQLVEKLTPNDNLLIFYAGHGHLDPATGEGYWLPVTANPRRRSEWISNSDISDTLRATVARHVLVISDSCFSGTLTRNASAGLTVSRDKRNYYEKLASRVSRTSLSSGGLEPVDDGGGGKHSVFAGALIAALKRNNEPLLEAESLYGQIKRPVALNSSATQKPQYSDVRATGHDDGDFLFFKRNTRAVKHQPIPVSKPASGTEQAQRVDTQAAYELTFWNSIEDSQDARDFEAYLNTYKQGRFAALARLRIKQLTSKQKPLRPQARPTPKVARIAPVETPATRPAQANEPGQVDNVLLVLATPDIDYSPEFNNVTAYSNAVAGVVKNIIKQGSMLYVAKHDVVRKVIAEDDEHRTSKQLCQQYQARRVLSIELNLTRDIEEMGRSADDVFIGLYNCKKQQYRISRYQLDFQNGEEFTYIEGLRRSFRDFNQTIR